jgi:hypothetical protein
MLGTVELGTILPPTPTLPHQGGGGLVSPSPLVGEGALFLPPPWWGRGPCFSLPPGGGGGRVSPSPTKGEGALFLPPPPRGRGPCFSLPPGGGGGLVSPSPLVGEGWGGGEREKMSNLPVPSMTPFLFQDSLTPYRKHLGNLPRRIVALNLFKEMKMGNVSSLRR